jgi:fatty acid desaturase
MTNASVERPTSTPRIPVNHVTQSFTELAATIRDAGLLRRSYTFYSIYFAALLLALGGVIAGMALIGDSWFQLLMAVALGVVLTQFAFLGHEASHRTIFKSGAANDNFGKFLSTFVVGMSYQWWMNKHSRHHANPNTVGKDPDINPDVIMFRTEDAVHAKGFIRQIVKRQGWLFFPLLTLEGLNLHKTAITSLITRGNSRQRWTELTGVVLHFVVYLVPLFMFLPVGLAFAFLGVQMAVFGVYMGASFAPNHKGMAIIDEDQKVDFLSKQVLTSRNIRGGWGMTIFMGGLNFQIEHHLFPNMARPHLLRTREIVREHCAEIGLAYTEVNLFRSYGIIVNYLNTVGLGARDPFDCPERVAMGR